MTQVYFDLLLSSAGCSLLTSVAHYRNIDTIIKEPTGAFLFVVRPSYRAQVPLILMFVAVLVVCVYLASAVLGSGTRLKWLPISPVLLARFLGLIPMLFLLELLRRRYNNLYQFGIHRVTHKKGRLSLQYEVPVIKYGDIRAINVRQRFWGRVLDFGSVSIGTAAQQDDEMVIEGVRAPEELARLIDFLRTKSDETESTEAASRVVGAE